MISPEYRFVISAATATFMFLVSFSWLIFQNGELYTVSIGMRQQLRTNGIYGRSVWDDAFAYKLGLVEQHPPRVLSVGSSRAMPIRSHLFKNSDHLSIGGSVRSLDDIEAWLTEIKHLKVRPSLIFVYLDFSWFLEGIPRPPPFADRRHFDEVIYLYQSAYNHVKELWRNISAKRYAADPETGGVLIGARAQRFGDGFRVDGSWRYLSYGLGSFPDTKLRHLLEDPDSPVGSADAETFAKTRRWWNGKVRADSYTQFERALGGLASLDIPLVVALPPVAPHLAMALENHQSLGFFPQVRKELAGISERMRAPFFDFTSTPLRGPDCFHDRYHASEGAYAWMFASMHRELARVSHAAATAFDEDNLRRFGTINCRRSLPPPVNRAAVHASASR